MLNDVTFNFGIDEIGQVVDTLYQLRDQCQVYALSGPLGSGKTTISQRLLRRFGVEGVITSPTFTYVNTYQLEDGTMLYHFDLYRISSVDEFILSGFNEYLYQPKSWAIIEWPEVVTPLLQHKVCELILLYVNEDMRQAKLKVLD